ncbi:MAG: glycosyltransferase family 2 protein [Bacteroidota bacterium]
MKCISVSIVLFHNKMEQILNVIKPLLEIDWINVNIYLIDNSSNCNLKELNNISVRIKYIRTNENLGYGAAHNIAIQNSIKSNCNYHIILNPDIEFEPNVIKELYNFMELNREVGNVMPKIIYPDGSIQYLCKLLPTPFDLIFRRFFPFKTIIKNRTEKYELRFTKYENIMKVPVTSGCFMFLRISRIIECGSFDERYFMYLEDFDFCRRIEKNVFYPKVEVTHHYAKDSYRSIRMLFYHIRSAIQYFNKWGWFFDKKRETINTNALNSLNKQFNLKAAKQRSKGL